MKNGMTRSNDGVKGKYFFETVTRQSLTNKNGTLISWLLKFNNSHSLCQMRESANF